MTAIMKGGRTGTSKCRMGRLPDRDGENTFRGGGDSYAYDSDDGNDKRVKQQ